MANESNCNWWDSSSTTRRTPTFSSSIIDSSGATVSASPDHHSSHMMGLGLSSHQPLHHHWNTNLHPNPPPLMKGDGGFRSILEEGMPEFSSMKRSSPSMFSHSNSSVDSSSHGGGLPSPTFLTPLESSGIFQGHIMASSPNDHNSGYGYHQPTGMIGMPMNSCNSDDMMMNWTTSSNKDQFSQLLKSSSMVDIPKPVQVQPQFMNMNSPGSFWNGVAAPVADPRPFFPVAPPQMAMPSFGDKRKNNVMEVRNASGVGRKSTSGSDRTSRAATASTTSTGGATAKRPRNEASSTALPPFKVRKEKMGDRITALQQLVSPFGKTDTASVLSEAIEYIKFLHEQVNTLSTPYLKSGVSLQQQQQRSHDKFKDPDEGARKDLRSRGLCLVPISSTFPVANETTVDFWTPTFGPAGAFR